MGYISYRPSVQMYFTSNLRLAYVSSVLLQCNNDRSDIDPISLSSWPSIESKVNLCRFALFSTDDKKRISNMYT